MPPAGSPGTFVRSETEGEWGRWDRWEGDRWKMHSVMLRMDIRGGLCLAERAVALVFLGQAFAHDAEGFVGQLLVAEWLVLLRYFTACGFVHEAFSAAAAAWLGQGTGQLQMAQLQELVAVLARSGHLQGEAVVNALKHLPTEPEDGMWSCRVVGWSS